MTGLSRLNLGTKFMLIVGLVVAVAISFIFVWEYGDHKKQVLREVEKQAEITFKQIVVTRQWNADYGGVYVEKREGAESNSYLRDVGVNPDITDVEGKDYTLKNPALMTKELSNYAETEELYQFHITSLKLINPDNAPDDFERQSLEEFEKGKKSVSQMTVKDGTRVFQYMAPLYVDEACLKCHGHQGYKVGDVRGGISVFLPMNEAYFAIQETKRNLFFFAVAIIFVLEAALYYLTGKLVVKPIEKLSKGVGEIGKGKLDYKLDVESDDEVGRLSSAFNEMTRKLKKSYTSLEEEIAERKRAEEELRLAASQWQGTFDAADDMVAIIDRNHRIVRANLAMKMAFKNATVTGALCYELVHGTDRPVDGCVTRAAFEAGRSARLEIREEHLGGCWLHIAGSPIKDESGKVQQVVHLMRDITERKQAEETLERRLEDLERVHKAFVGRELKMRELKEEIKRLEERPGEGEEG